MRSEFHQEFLNVSKLQKSKKATFTRAHTQTHLNGLRMRINLSSESAVSEEPDELCGSPADAPAPCMFARTQTHVQKYTHYQIGLACVAEHAPVDTGAAICKPRVLQTKSLKRFKNYLHKELM